MPVAESHAPEKPQFHWSHLESLFMCGWRYHLAYEQGLKARPGIAMATGSAVHLAAAKNLLRKAETAALMSPEELDDVARDAFREQWLGGVDLMPDEAELGVEIVHDNAVDRSIALARVHANLLAPIIRPHVGGVEKSWVVEVDGFPWDLAGEIDVEEAEKVIEQEHGDPVVLPSSIRDLKTTGKLPSPKLVASSGQLSMYSIAHATYHDGQYPERVFFDYAMGTAAGTLKAGSFGSIRRPEHIEAFWQSLEMAAEVIEKQAFTHSRPNVDWWCSQKWCGFARTNPDTGRPFCKYFSEAPTFVALSFTSANQQGGIHGKSAKRATRRDREELLSEL